LALFRTVGPARPSAAAGKLGSFRIFCVSRPCPSRAKLASFRTFDPQQIGFVLHDQQVRPDSRNRLPQQKLVSLCLIQKLGSFRTIAPQRGLPTPTARAHSWALGRNWVRFAQWDVPGGRLGANWVCFSRLPTARVPQAWPILCREPPTDHCELVRLPSTDYRLLPFGDLGVSVMRSLYHKKTLLDARLLTQKAEIPQKSSRQAGGGRPQAVVDRERQSPDWPSSEERWEPGAANGQLVLNPMGRRGTRENHQSSTINHQSKGLPPTPVNRR
jgi:hypothetical protein